MVSWTHCSCRECYPEHFPGQMPYVLKDADEEPCCFCGKENRDGIFVRYDSRKLDKCECTS